MRNPFLFLPILVMIIIGMFFSCKKEPSREGGREWNKPPVAVAGPDRVITLPTDSVSLDGRSSSDPDGTIIGFRWSKISGPASFTIGNMTSALTVAKNLTVGTYLFELKVTDDKGLSAKDTMQVIVDAVLTTNHAPFANAGHDTTISFPVNTTILDGGRSSDPDNNITSYAWSKISGPSSFVITSSNVVQTQVTNLIQGAYQFELKVTDAGGLFSADTVQVWVLNQIVECTPGTRSEINAQLIPVSNNLPGDFVGAIGSKMFFLSGYNTLPGGGAAYQAVVMYDISTNTQTSWPLNAPRDAIGVTTFGDKIFFAGGEVHEDVILISMHSQIDIYDVSTNSWTLQQLSKPKYSVTAGSIGNKVFFAGGHSGSHFLNEVEILDLTSNTWSYSTLSEGRTLMNTVTANNKIYFAGGFNNSSVSSMIDIYDNATGVWTVSSLAAPKAVFPGIALSNKIYWAGGVNSFSSSSFPLITANVEIRDIQSNTSSAACLFAPRADFSAVIKDNKIIFFTGSHYAGSNGLSHKFDIYDPTTNTWSIGVMGQSIVGKAVTINNEIYIMGIAYNISNINVPVGYGIWRLEF